MAKTAVIILAAGRGTRLKSELPKVLHQAGGKPLLAHVLAAVAGAGLAPQDTVVVTGFGTQQVGELVHPLGVRTVLQEPQKGTGHAVQVARDLIAGYDRALILCGDMPLVSSATVSGLLHTLQEGVAAVLATAEPDIPRAYGRILRRGEQVIGIVEDKQASPEHKKIKELNAGFYLFHTADLWWALDRVGTDNPHGEYYLTDTVALLASAGKRVLAFRLPDEQEILGINDRVELAQVDLLFRRRKLRELMETGVTAIAPETILVDCDVTVGADTILEPGVQLLGTTRIGRNCRVRSYSVISDSVIGDGVLLKPFTVLEAVEVREGAELGPFTRVREHAVIGAEARLGNFVEVKKSKLGKGVKASHLTYLGDAEVGDQTNIGAGTITCNYDGVRKHTTRIGDGVFVGSNSTLVAPVTVENGAYVAAGSVITETVPADALALGRSRQTNKEHWARRRREKHRAEAKKS